MVLVLVEFWCVVVLVSFIIEVYCSVFGCEFYDIVIRYLG